MQTNLLMALSVAGGGALGALLRWLLALKIISGSFPYATFLVNALGSLLIGFLFVYLQSIEAAAWLRAGLITGLLGGFTTYSAFSLETLLLFEKGQVRTAVLYIFMTLAICLLAAYVGMWLAKKL